MRLKELDSLRGLAALAVVFHHCYLTLPDDLRRELWRLSFTPLGIIMAGRPAVILFFVLSGFVLSLPFLSDAPPRYLRYLIKRICRIYIPVVAAVSLSALLYLLIRPSQVTESGVWLSRNSWNSNITLSLLFSHFAMTGSPQSTSLDSVLWSLIYELRISIIFPVLVLLVKLDVFLALVLALISQIATDFTLLYTGLDLRPYSGNSILQSILITNHFVIFFILGVSIAKNMPRLQVLLFGARPIVEVLLFTAAICTLWMPVDLLNGVGAALLIVLSLTAPKVSQALSLPAFQWLGRISYSLYLSHLIVLLATVHVLFRAMPVIVILVGVIPLSLICAHLMYRYVEIPSIELGRRLSGGNAVQKATAVAAL